MGCVRSSPQKAETPIEKAAQIGGVDVALYSDDVFSKIRIHFGVNAGQNGLGFLGKDKVSLENLAPGGGKGGTHMTFTKDRKIIVKELSDGDHKSLSRVTSDYAE